MGSSGPWGKGSKPSRGLKACLAEHVLFLRVPGSHPRGSGHAFPWATSAVLQAGPLTSSAHVAPTLRPFCGAHRGIPTQAGSPQPVGFPVSWPTEDARTGHLPGSVRQTHTAQTQSKPCLPNRAPWCSRSRRARPRSHRVQRSPRSRASSPCAWFPRSQARPVPLPGLSAPALPAGVSVSEVSWKPQGGHSKAPPALPVPRALPPCR